jgi:hypothetical protein
MDDDTTTTPLQIARTAEAHLEKYREASQLQRELARRCLASEPPQLSEAATACHRAYQFRLEADALEQLAKDAGLW